MMNAELPVLRRADRFDATHRGDRGRPFGSEDEASYAEARERRRDFLDKYIYNYGLP